MRGRQLNNLVNNAATLAAKGEHVTAYVILYQESNGDINYHRDGQSSAQVGMLEIAKRGVINGLFDAPREDEE